MNIKKKIALFTTIFLLTLLLIVLVGFKIYFSAKYPSKELKTTIITLFKKNLNRAVKFDTLTITFYGNIELENFVLSSTNDFNDNVNLLKAKKAIFKPDFIKFLGNRISLHEILFKSPQITLQKPSGKSHKDTFKQIKELLKSVNALHFIDYKNFNIIFHNATIQYSEILKDHTISLGIHSINCDLNIQNNIFRYMINGTLDQHHSTNLEKGKIILEGRYSETEKAYVHLLHLQNIDLSYFNEFISAYKISDNLLTGGLSTKMNILDTGSEYRIKGFSQTNNLHLISNSIDHFNIISNENMDIQFDLISNHTFNRIELKSLNITDDNINLKCNGDYNKNKKSNNYRLLFSSNTIDLSELSHYFTPVHNISYTGKLKIDGDILYHSSDKNNNKSTCQIILTGINIFRHGEKQKKRIIKDGTATLRLFKQEIKTSVAFNTNTSDYTVNKTTIIKKWHPFNTDSKLSIQSQNAQLEEIAIPYKLLFKTCYDRAYQDIKKGYEEIFFLQKPLAIYMNNNNIDIEFHAANIKCGKKATFTDCAYNLKLNKGILSLDKLTWNGYDAKYNLDIKGFFNRDYPLIKASGSISNFDLAGFTNDYDVSGKIEGKAAFDFEYELTAYRISHLLTNAKGKYNCYITKPVFRDTYTQKQIEVYLHQNGYRDINMRNIETRQISANISQYSDTYHIRNFNLAIPELQFSSYGKYTVKDGLDYTINARFQGENRKYHFVPLEVRSSLLSPCIKIKKNSINQQVCL